MNPDRIDRALEGRLSEEEWRTFQRDVIADDELRRAYAEAAWLHGQLAAAGDSLPGLLGAATADDSPPNRPEGRPLLRALPWGIAAALAVAFVVFAITRPEAFTPPEYVATLTEADNCRWAGSELPTNEGARLTAGVMDLAEGMATLEFESGATLTLEAPARVEVRSKMDCRLLAGSIVADVPESAHGFTIATASMDVVDLGTKFALTASEFGDSHVYVLDGEVEVHRNADKKTADQKDSASAQNRATGDNRATGESKPSRLTTGKTLFVGGSAPPAGHEFSRRARRDDATPGDDWTPLSTLTGRGKDGYIRRGNSGKTTSRKPLLMVKHTSLVPNNNRRALLTFDLAGVDRDRIEDVKLTLQAEASGLGFAAMIPDSRFAIYGVRGDHLDHWKESELTWKSSPTLTAPELSPEHFVELAGFELKRGASTDLTETSSPALLDFVKSHPDDLLGFVLVRTTDEFDKQGLVHAFASREHPRSRPPTLWIREKEQR